jgi:predicted DNA-binding transcriptional regulator AlpA
LPSSYLTRSSLATELEISESTVDEMVRRGVLPKPVRLSSGCVRWRWASVDLALASLGGEAHDTPSSDAAAGVQRAIQAAKDHGRGRTA